MRASLRHSGVKRCASVASGRQW